MSLNKEQQDYEREEIHRDALKGLIRDELRHGPGHAANLAERLGESSGKRFVEILHEMESNKEISFGHARGYRL